MRSLSILFVVVSLSSSCLPALPKVSQEGGQAAGQDAGEGARSGGTWQPGWLEIHHIDAGEAVSTLIVAPSGKSLLIDAGEAAWNESAGAIAIGAYVRGVLGCGQIDYVLISHFHLDHVGYPGFGGIWHLVHEQGFTIGKLIHRDVDNFMGTKSGTLQAWRTYLRSSEGQAMHPEVAVTGTGQIDLGAGVTFTIVGADGAGQLRAGNFSDDSAPPDENDYSIAALLRTGRLDYFTAGDLSGETLIDPAGYSYHDIETKLAVKARDVDVYRVSHHGSSHASNATLLAELAPRVSIIQVGNDNPNHHPSQATVDRLLARSALYLTERGDTATDLHGAKVVGNVVLRTANGIDYTVNGDRFVASDPPRTDGDGDGYFLEADTNDASASITPAENGGCDPTYQTCQTCD